MLTPTTYRQHPFQTFPIFTLWFGGSDEKRKSWAYFFPIDSEAVSWCQRDRAKESGGRDMKSSCGETRDDSNSAAKAELRLQAVLGLRCLSIVLSYLEEFEGTSFLLSQNNYWADTILPLLRIPSSLNKSKKHRHKFSLRNNVPVIRIPDASTRLERLNTRRWNTQQRRRRQREKKQPQLQVQKTTSLKAINRSTTELAEQEWNKTVATDDNIQDDATPSEQSTLAMPPLLRFYQYETTRRQYFLPGTTCLASYPRSGNTLLRSLLETVTGFATSSDTRPDRNLSIALAEKPPYFVGEGLAPQGNRSTTQHEQSKFAFLPPQMDGRLLAAPPICKTHWPERVGCHAYDCDRVVLLVRNPFDAADSYWHMNLTNTHTEKVQPHVTEEHKRFYESLVRHEILQVWISFLDYYWKECSKHRVPLLLVRYEDLVLNPRDELQRILKFSCGKNSGGDDWWKRRLEEATNTSASGKNASSAKHERKTDKFGYKSSSLATEINTPDRCSHPSIGRSLRRGMFPDRLLKAIHEFDDLPQSKNGCGNWLERLGYHVYKQGFPNNLDQLPPVPKLEFTRSDNDDGKLTMNIQDVSLELRPRDSPYGRNMRQWRRKYTAKDTQPFPTL